MLGQIAAMVAVSLCLVLLRGTTMCNPSFLLPFANFSAVLVGPIVTGLWRQDPSRRPVPMIGKAVGRACGAMLLILMASLILVNLIAWHGLAWSGSPLLPSGEALFASAAVSITVAWAVAATLALVLKRVSTEAAKWGFRLVMLAVILVYQNLPPPIFWPSPIADLGLTTIALGWAGCCAILASGEMLWLRRPANPLPD